MTAPNTPHDDQVLTEEAGPQRKCVVSGSVHPKPELIRFARSPDGIVTPDTAERLPGRGVWVRADRTAVDTAATRNAFARGFRQACTAPDGLSDMVEGLLLARCQSLLGLANKAGALVCGAEKVRADLQFRAPGWLIHARDSGEDGRKKVYGLAKALYEAVNVAGGLSSQELGVALGRDHVVHAVLKKGRFAKLWATEYRRLTGFRPAPEDDWFS